MPSRPRQYEFARLNLTYTVMSKRKLLQLVQERHVSRLGRPAACPPLWGSSAGAITARGGARFCERIGVGNGRHLDRHIVLGVCVREDLNGPAPRVMAVLRPLKVVIDNYPADQVEEFEAVNNPENPEMGSRSPLFPGAYIEQEDFRENPPRDSPPGPGTGGAAALCLLSSSAEGW